MLTILLIGLFFLSIAPILYRKYKSLSGWFLSLYPLSCLIYFIANYSAIFNHGAIIEKFEWIKSLDIYLSFQLDGLSLTFSIIICLVGTFISLYASKYMEEYEDAGRFLSYIILFMISMLGLVLSNNLISLFVFWELTSISSYLLIGFNHHLEKARKAALQALLVTGSGGLSLLAGFIIVYLITGSYELDKIYNLHSLLIQSPYYNAAAILILIGAFAKSAQFPFHFWLPNAMEAPTPASAYLHSATMVKAGIYLIARLNHSFGGSEIWQFGIIVIGSITIILSSFLVFKHSDLKKILAYTTINALGFLTLLLGISGDIALKAFYIFLWAHSLYKASLFLTAGIIDHETGTRNVELLSGLRTKMPKTFITAILAGSSMMGIIPLVGFISKETIYSALLEIETYNFLFLSIAVFANAAIVMASLLVIYKPFTGDLGLYDKYPHDPPLQMMLSAFILSIIGLLFGLFPKFFIQGLLEMTADSLKLEEFSLKVKLWHGFNFPLVLSFITLFSGIGLYHFRNKYFHLFANLKLRNFLTAEYFYDQLLNAVISVAKVFTKLIQNGYLRFYLISIILFAIIFSSDSLLKLYEDFNFKIEFDGEVYEFFLVLIIILATIFTIRSDSRLKSIIGLGTIGFCIGVLYVIYSAPDLALTTFAVETLTVILFALVLYKLPKLENLSSVKTRFRDMAIASISGLFIFFTIIYTTRLSSSDEIKTFYAENSLEIAKGRNIVNVILVDFRGLDTLGEITVLSIAAIGVFTLLKLKK